MRYKMNIKLNFQKNDTSSKKKLRVLRGVKNLMDVGVVVEFNGKTNISTWGDDYCDTFNGTDGTIFHPFLYEDEDVVSFAPDLCRSLSTTFEKKTKVAGMPKTFSSFSLKVWHNSQHRYIVYIYRSDHKSIHRFPGRPQYNSVAALLLSDAGQLPEERGNGPFQVYRRTAHCLPSAFLSCR